MDYILNFFYGFKFNGTLAVYLYWMPLAVCAVGYFIRTAKNYVNDRKKREERGGYYVPSDTIGSLIARAVVTILPIGNMFAAVFDIGPSMLGRFFDWVGAVFNQPLVPDSESAKAKRKVEVK